MTLLSNYWSAEPRQVINIHEPYASSRRDPAYHCCSGRSKNKASALRIIMAAGKASLAALGLQFCVENKLLSKSNIPCIFSCVRRGKRFQSPSKDTNVSVVNLIVLAFDTDILTRQEHQM